VACWQKSELAALFDIDSQLRLVYSSFVSKSITLRQLFLALLLFLVNLMTATPDSPSPNPLPLSENLPMNNAALRVVWDSQALLSGQREVFIQHGSECYRLILTKSGKLILQK